MPDKYFPYFGVSYTYEYYRTGVSYKTVGAWSLLIVHHARRLKESFNSMPKS